MVENSEAKKGKKEKEKKRTQDLVLVIKSAVRLKWIRGNQAGYEQQRKEELHTMQAR